MSLAPTIGKAGACLLGLTATAALVLMPEPAPAADPSPGQACASAPFFNLADNERALGDELEILSWNVQKSSNTGWAEDMALLGNATDLAFIQEASTVSGISNLIPRLLHRAFSRGYTTDTMETGVMTLSSGLPDMHCSLTAMEPWLGTPKATSVTSYALKDRSDRLLAINLHAVNFAFGLDEFGQQFADLRHLLDAHEGPVILAGDLNTWSDKRQSLVDRFASEFDLQPVSFEPDLRTTVFGRALDHVYVRGLRTLSAEVIPVDTSDHNPLRVRLGLR